ncbi:hypothetical protein [Aphanothece sacrum]|uniref:Uncharacterized protein n=1 Tax=Aphanothece sacrum FPU1 TaxID=1920663 RepID=A0A401IMB6_APHSA|nr:hypothetical protein [Aphanothece sacrum]GBF82410.1 hypothetical protein AsFPU1_3839 [Aphanothece sacrum FPU1]GBF84435.1 hypothetical protein AsFPU3_1484 [Aphanothece sacrum FPU3]
MQHTIKPFNPDKIYEIVISACFSIKAKTSQEAKQKLEALLSEMDADHWEFEKVIEVEN